jgi:methylenetetrahydrofolate reductase (NADPH)
MNVARILGERKSSVSFEFFPPKTQAGWTQLSATIKSLAPLEPAFVSVTYGAGGATRENTHALVEELKRTTDLEVVAHLTCVGSTRRETLAILERYRQAGVDTVLALRGDPPKDGVSGAAGGGELARAADLVALVKEFDPGFCVGVAGFPEGHPQSPNRLKEMDYLKAKVDAGADYIVTQLFFDNRDFYDFAERCELAGIAVPIIPGIMPVTSLASLHRMADLSPGSRFPAALLRALGRARDEELVRNVGVQWATEQIRDLLDHKIKGVHLYTLNHSDAGRKICANLGLLSYRDLG